jgi:hypothetical protein
VIFAFFAVTSLGATDRYESYSPMFFGLSTELTMFPSPAEDAFLSGAAIESLCFMAVLGHRRILSYPKIRARGGIGFWSDRAFITKFGLEVPVFEVLNSMQARLFGFYIYTDGIMRIGSSDISLSAEASARMLIPFSAVGGIALGCGYDLIRGYVLHIDYLAGFYSIK